MAQGKTANMSISEVKSVCSSLEISPSCHSAQSNIYGDGGQTASQPKHSSSGKTHSGKRNTKETPEKLNSANEKRGH